MIWKKWQGQKRERQNSKTDKQIVPERGFHMPLSILNKELFPLPAKEKDNKSLTEIFYIQGNSFKLESECCITCTPSYKNVIPMGNIQI